MSKLPKDLTKMENFLLKSPYPDIEIPSCDLWNFYAEKFQKVKNNVALIDPELNLHVTYNDIFTASEKIAINLGNLGCNPEKPVAICMSNCIEFVYIVFAVWRIGGMCVLFSPWWKQGEIRPKLLKVKPEFIFANIKTIENVLKATTDMNAIKIISTEERDGCITLTSLLNKKSDVECNTPQGKHADNTKLTAVMAFSSGTTGEPKVIQITHAQLIHILIWYSFELQTILSPGIICQPMSHAWIFGQMLHFLSSGLKVIIMHEPDLNKFVSFIEHYKVTVIYITPSIAYVFCKNEILRKYDVSCLKLIHVSGAPLNPEIELGLKQLLDPRTIVVQGYGMTEMNTCTQFPYEMASSKDIVKRGSVGWPIINTVVKVIDCAIQKNVGANINGEICIKKSFPYKGYYEDDEATANAFDEQGWFHTGDLGYYDEDGCIFIIDRLKELIKVEGIQVSPSELEGVILSHSDILEAAVTSVPDIEKGELPYAWIVKKFGSNLTETEIQEYVSERVSDLKRLWGVRFVERIPKTDLGKNARKRIKQETLAFLQK